MVSIACTIEMPDKDDIVAEPRDNLDPAEFNDEANRATSDSITECNNSNLNIDIKNTNKILNNIPKIHELLG